ncbi:MAG: histidine kinase [Cyclobacteriaceae bacterium]|nr:histidine kinase [Cyclobacteriaceae bacterium HetDA_MAG_MS6]
MQKLKVIIFGILALLCRELEAQHPVLEQLDKLLIARDVRKADSLLSVFEMDTVNISKQDKISYLNNKGRLLYLERKFDEALIFYYQALDHAQKGGDLVSKSKIYMEIAETLSESNDLENVTKYYRLALELARQKPDTVQQVKIYGQLCKVFNGWVTLNLDSSVYYGEKGLALANISGNPENYFRIASLLAAPLIRIGENKRGMKMSGKALEMSERFPLSNLMKYFLILNHGYAYNNLKEYDSALVWLERAEAFDSDRIDHHRLRYLIFKETGNLEKALSSLEIYAERRYAINQRRNNSRISNLQARYEANLKEQEVDKLSQKAELQAIQLQQRDLAISLGIVLVILISLIAYLIVRNKLAHREKAKLQSEQRFLLSQLNPHFISNALLAIQQYMLRNDSNEAAIYLAKFSRLMREILENSRQEFIPVEREMKMLKNYLDIHQIRLKNFSYTLQLSDSIEEEMDRIPPMFIQPFVENAVEHGIGLLPGNGKIAIKLEKEGEFISVAVEDNGKGLSREIPNKESGSLSTSIIQERIALFNRTLKNKIQFSIEEIKGSVTIAGTRVKLLIPFTT